MSNRTYIKEDKLRVKKIKEMISYKACRDAIKANHELNYK